MVTKIISGGQTGADQGGLWGAREAGFPTGGYAPANFLTENGPSPEILKFYRLVDSGLDYVGTTRKNVVESDITLWFGRCSTSGYTTTARACQHYGKEMFRMGVDTDPLVIASIIKKYSIINIAGNREFKYRGLFRIVGDKINAALCLIKEGKGVNG